MARFYLLSVFIWGDFCLLGDVTVFYRLLSSLLTGWILNAYAAGGTNAQSESLLRGTAGWFAPVARAAAGAVPCSAHVG